MLEAPWYERLSVVAAFCNHLRVEPSTEGHRDALASCRQAAAFRGKNCLSLAQNWYLPELDSSFRGGLVVLDGILRDDGPPPEVCWDVTLAGIVKL